MLLAMDVQYQGDQALVAAVAFNDWHSAQACGQYLSRVGPVAPYLPGQFYKRELPCLLALLQEHRLAPKVIVIDGYVYLDGHSKPGLGWHLHQALGGQGCVIGVAKKAFAGIGQAHELLRGQSQKPLFVTSTADLAWAKACIGAMSGQHRLPILLKMADQLCRAAAKANP